MDKHGHTGERDKYRKKKREKVYVKKKNSMNPYLCFHQFLKKKKKKCIYIYIFMFPPPLIDPRFCFSSIGSFS